MNEIATIPTERKSLVTKFAERFGVEPNRMLSTLKATAFKQRGDTEITNEQMMALLVVADQYGLNPWTKEIFAFEDKGSIVPVVSVDGWSRIINSHSALDGIEFRYSDKMLNMPDAKPCPEWCEVVIRRKDRSQPIVVREYLDEVYRPPFQKRGGDYKVTGPWQTHTKRFLRHKALIQGARIAFGFAGIYDEDEGHRIIEAESVRVVPTDRKVELDALSERIQSRAIEHDPPAIMNHATGEILTTKQIRAAIERAETMGELTALGEAIASIPDDAERQDCEVMFDSRSLSLTNGGEA